MTDADADDDDADEGAGSVTLTGAPTSATASSSSAGSTSGDETMGVDPTGDPLTSGDPDSNSTSGPTTDPPTTTNAESSSSTGEPLDPRYFDCFNDGEDICEDGEVCVYDHPPSPAVAVCLQLGCSDDSECPDPPPGGDAPPTCGGVATPKGDECHLDCSAGQTCPTGMVCTSNMLCMWPQHGMAQQNFFTELPSNWTVYDEDGEDPAAQVSFIDEGWVVSDWAGPWAALSTSYYSPSGQADDWLVTPPIAISDGSVVSFEAASVDENFPDAYEVRISTATRSVADFLANPALMAIAAENEILTTRMIDLAAEGYSDQIVYLAWRNVSDNKFVLVVDDIEVSY